MYHSDHEQEPIKITEKLTIVFLNQKFSVHFKNDVPILKPHYITNLNPIMYILSTDATIHNEVIQVFKAFGKVL